MLRRSVVEGLPATVLLHGIFAWGRYWGGGYDVLAGEACLAVSDLAGFGRSQHELPLTDTVACVGEIRRMRDELVPGRGAKVAPPVRSASGAILCSAGRADATGPGGGDDSTGGDSDPPTSRVRLEPFAGVDPSRPAQACDSKTDSHDDGHRAPPSGAGDDDLGHDEADDDARNQPRRQSDLVLADDRRGERGDACCESHGDGGARSVTQE